MAFFGYSVLTLGIYFFAAFSLGPRLRGQNFTTLPEILDCSYGKHAAAPEGYFFPFGGTPVWLMLAYASLNLCVLVDPCFSACH